MKINHVAIAVENVEDAAKTYQDALDIKSVEFETVESEGVKVAILHLENANIELMEPTNDSSPIRKFLEKRGSGLHHIALETPNIVQCAQGGFVELGMGRVCSVATGIDALEAGGVGGTEDRTDIEGAAQIVEHQIKRVFG